LSAVNGSIVAPDGMPLVWLARRGAAEHVERVYGPDVLIAASDAGQAAGYRHFFYGSTRETLRLLVERLRMRFPGLVVAGTYAPPFGAVSAEEDARIVETINSSGADVVWVGLGMPKQELWIAEHQDRLDAPLLMAVGAAFDFHAGTVKQAPRWMQRSGLEWLYRLAQEPRRLWRRYLLGNLRFAWLVLRAAVRREL
jgi:N-acetylglucosaminyldiphosphoundecaprenol N-acetyl-beta-D-mannosaminyltransferase